MKCYKHTHRVGGKSDPEVEHYHCVECNTTQPAIQPAEAGKTGGITEAGLDVVEVSRECSWCSHGYTSDEFKEKE